MTTAVALARPHDLLRAACLLGGSADQLGTAIAACRRSASVDWVGRPNENYQERLSHLARGLVGMQAAFAEACDALLAYARALGAVQPLAEEADRLVLQGSEALIERAALLRAEAREAEAVAAMRLAIVLDDLTSRAPRVRGFGAQLGLTHFARGFVSGVEGLGDTVSSLWHALPGVGSDDSRSKARDELGQTALDAVQPWKAVQQLWDAINDGHGLFVAGEMVAPWFLKAHLSGSRARALFLDQEAVNARVMLVLVRGAEALSPDAVVDWYLAQHLRKELVLALERLSREPLPHLDDLLYGVDLVHQEARGAHVLQRHIGRDKDFLESRQIWDQADHGRSLPKSTFGTLDEAERLVTDAIRDNEAKIRAFLADPTVSQLRVATPVGDVSGLVIDHLQRTVLAREVVVMLEKAGDTVRIETAYLN